MTARGTWKAAERRVATSLNGQRIPVTGIDRHGADVITPLLAVQVKLRKSLPGWLFEWVNGICGTAGPDRCGVLVLRKPRMRDGDALVVMKMSDFSALYGDVPLRGRSDAE